MEFPDPLLPATLIRRYKRFLADVELPDGEITTLHCPNTGSMKNCQEPGSRIWYSLSDNPKRKYPGTWQVVEVDQQHLVGINTGLANKLVHEFLSSGGLPSLQRYERIRTEVPYGQQGSRIDLLFDSVSRAEEEMCYVEVKNVSLGVGGGKGLFPDAVTSRGQKHLQELMEVAHQGHRALLFFCVQHTGITRLAPADEIDPTYGSLLREAANNGVDIVAVRSCFDIARSTVTLSEEIPVLL